MRTGMGLWRGDEGTSSPVEETNGGQSYLNVGTGGLFPSVAPPKSGKHSKGGSGSSAGHRGSSGSTQKPKARLDLFRFLGRYDYPRAFQLICYLPPTHPMPMCTRFIGKALQDERLLDLPLSPVLCKLLLGHPLTLHDVAAVDPVLGRSLLEMQRMANGTHKGGKLKEYLEALHLDFTLPGAHWCVTPLHKPLAILDSELTRSLPNIAGGRYELKAGGSDELVTCERVHEYLDLVTRHLLVDSVRESVDAVRAGIEDVMPLAALRCFGPEELQVRRPGVWWLLLVEVLSDSHLVFSILRGGSNCCVGGMRRTGGPRRSGAAWCANTATRAAARRSSSSSACWPTSPPSSASSSSCSSPARQGRPHSSSDHQAFNTLFSGQVLSASPGQRNQAHA